MAGTSYAPLSGLKVLEAASGIAAGYCGRILADLGACVYRVPDAGDSEVKDAHDPISAELEAWIHHGKDAIGAGQPCEVDVVIADRENLGRFSGTTTVCITPFGLKGPLATIAACELTIQHASGLAYHQASPVSDPENLPPRACSDREAAMATGVAGALAALWGLLGNAGSVSDLSMCDFLSHLLVEPVAEHRDAAPAPSRQRSSAQPIAIAGGLVWMLACSDGFVMISPREDHQWRRWLQVMGDPGWSREPSLCGTREARAAHVLELQQLMNRWTGPRTRREVADAAQAGGIACFPVNRPSDLLDNDQLEHRRFFDRMMLADGRLIAVPGLPFHIRGSDGSELPKGRRFSAGPRRRPATSAGAPWAPADGQAPETGVPAAAALTGIRVIDFSWVMAGPMCTKMLAAMGAEVIKVETSVRPEYSNRGGWFDVLNNSKRSCSVDITKPEGQELVRRLVAKSDVVVENFSAGVLAKYGLSHEDLREISPALVYASASGLGRQGPQRNALAYGTLLQAYSGRCGLIGAPGPTLEAMGVLPAWTDPVTAFWEAVGIVAAVIHARRSGIGAFIDVSMLESTISLLPESLLAAQGAGEAVPPLNSERDAAPSGCFRCCDDDAWLALSIRTDAEWDAACAALEIEEGRRPCFVDIGSRLRHKADADALIATRLRAMTALEGEQRLRRVGVPAARSRSIREVIADSDRDGHGLFPRMPKGNRTIAMPWTDRNGWRGEILPAPSLGADNPQILAGLLGMAPQEIARLEESGVIR